MVVEKGPAPRDRDIPPDDSNEEPEVSEQEYAELNNKLDELNGYLDTLEQKNADIHKQLLDLLETSKSTREEFQKIVEGDGSSDQASQQ